MMSEIGRSREVRRKVEETFDDISADFDRTRYKPWSECVRFERTLERGMLVLDIGCGNGRNAIFLAERHRVIGLDISQNMLAMARKNVALKRVGNRIELVRSDAVSIPLKDSCIDVGFYIAALHHVARAEERLECMKELRRVMKEGGRALVTVWAFDQPKFQLLLGQHMKCKKDFGNVEVPWKLRDGRKVKRFYHLFYGNELKELALDAGFEVLDYSKSNDNYHAVVKK